MKIEELSEELQDIKKRIAKLESGAKEAILSPEIMHSNEKRIRLLVWVKDEGIRCTFAEPGDRG